VLHSLIYVSSSCIQPLSPIAASDDGDGEDGTAVYDFGVEDGEEEDEKTVRADDHEEQQLPQTHRDHSSEPNPSQAADDVRNAINATNTIPKQETKQQPGDGTGSGGWSLSKAPTPVRTLSPASTVTTIAARTNTSPDDASLVSSHAAGGESKADEQSPTYQTETEVHESNATESQPAASQHDADSSSSAKQEQESAAPDRPAVPPPPPPPSASKSPLQQLSDHVAKLSKLNEQRCNERHSQIAAFAQRAADEARRVEAGRAHRRRIHAQLPDSHFPPAPGPIPSLPRFLEGSRAAPIKLFKHAHASESEFLAASAPQPYAKGVMVVPLSERYERRKAELAACLKRQGSLSASNKRRHMQPSRFSALDEALRRRQEGVENGAPTPYSLSSYTRELIHRSSHLDDLRSKRWPTVQDRLSVSNALAKASAWRIDAVNTRTSLMHGFSGSSHSCITPCAPLSRILPPSIAARLSSSMSNQHTEPTPGTAIQRLQQRASEDMQRVQLLKLAYVQRAREQSAIAQALDATNQGLHELARYEDEINAVLQMAQRREAAERQRLHAGDPNWEAPETEEYDSAFYDAFERERLVRIQMERMASKGIEVDEAVEKEVLARGADAEPDPWLNDDDDDAYGHGIVLDAYGAQNVPSTDELLAAFGLAENHEATATESHEQHPWSLHDSSNTWRPHSDSSNTARDIYECKYPVAHDDDQGPQAHVKDPDAADLSPGRVLLQSG